jgi:hypothetical protein
MNKKPKLKLDFCSYEAAKWSCLNLHHSKKVPRGKLVKIGVWEDNKFIGCIIYGLGATHNLSRILDMKKTEVCELVRVALGKHHNEVTKMIKISLKILSSNNPGLKAVISYADKDQGHNGGIYRGGNWEHIGMATDQHYALFGKKVHPKSVVMKYGTRSLKWIRENVDKDVSLIETKGKHRFVYYLDKKMRAKHKSNALTDQVRKGGAVPTSTLQTTKESKK